MAPAEAAMVNIEVVFCPRPGVTDALRLQLAAPATVAAAVQASGVLQRHGLDLVGVQAGVWNRVREPDFALREGDRVEIYRALTVDPKEARRLRYKRHRESGELTTTTKATKAAKLAKT